MRFGGDPINSIHSNFKLVIRMFSIFLMPTKKWSQILVPGPGRYSQLQFLPVKIVRTTPHFMCIFVTRNTCENINASKEIFSDKVSAWYHDHERVRYSCKQSLVRSSTPTITFFGDSQLVDKECALITGRVLP